MSIRKSLSFRNCVGKPGRSVALMILSLFLSFCLLSGSMLFIGLRSGLNSLDARLGADIMVVPYEASTKSKLSDMFLQGNPGYFYMDESVVDDISNKIEGIGKMSTQFYLASSSSSCCSYKVQLIGFDPDTDFTILPWAQNTFSGELADGEVLVGHTLNAFKGDELQFYGTTVKVAERLDETGTYLDTAVYANKNTIKKLITSAYESKIYNFGDMDPDNVVSCVMIDVADGYSVDEVLNDINLHIKGVSAVKSTSVTSDVSSKLSGISDIAIGIIIAVWVLILIIQLIAFNMIFNSRMKEFAILRVIGASRKKLTSILRREALLLSVVGSAIGVGASIIVMELFAGSIEKSLNMPFLLPSGIWLVMIIVASIVASIAASMLAAVICSHKAGKVDAAVILRGDN